MTEPARQSRPVGRLFLFLAGIVLLASSACVPPVAFQDGLPAWALAPRGVEWRVGYQQLSTFGTDSFDLFGLQSTASRFNVGYLTPGVRVGLDRKRLNAELGLTSALRAKDGFAALLGGEFGLGYSDPKISVMFRPSLYLFNFYCGGGSKAGVDVAPWGQVSFLVGNGYRARGLNFALGGRAGEYVAGPVAFVGYNLHPVEFRAELSDMVPVSYYASGNVLTIGLTVAAPTKP